MTGKSDTKDKAFVRYTMTTKLLQRLYNEKPWQKDSAIQQINGYHSNAANFTSRMSNTEMENRSEAILKDQIEKLGPLDHILLENLQDIRSIHFSTVEFNLYEKYICAPIIFSQFDMAMVQSAFFSSILCFPEMYGVQDVSK